MRNDFFYFDLKSYFEFSHVLLQYDYNRDKIVSSVGEIIDNFAISMSVVCAMAAEL